MNAQWGLPHFEVEDKRGSEWKKFGDKGDSGSFLCMKRNRKVWSLESSKWKIKVMEGSSVTREIQYDRSSI